VGRLFGRALQTDAYTSPANYGGPVIDIEGRVLGIAVPLSRAGRDAGAELYDSGIGFAATVADIGPLLERMKRGETLHRGWLGVSTVTTWLGPGARLQSVAQGSAAAMAGLAEGDMILAVDDVAVRNSFHLQDRSRRAALGRGRGEEEAGVKPHHLVFALCVTLPLAVLVFWVGVSGAAPLRTDGPWDRPLGERRFDPFPREFHNASGDTVLVPRPPQRIVSGTVFGDALLLRTCPPQRILALHHLSTDRRYSPVAEASAAFPRHHGGGAEEILALAPDLVIVSSFSRRETRQLLGRHGCAVLRFEEFASVADIQSNMRALGYVLDLDEPTEGLLAEMNATLDRVAAGRGKRGAWRVLHYDAGRTSGPGSTFDSLLDYVGAANAATSLGISGSQSVAPEQVLALDPDALVMGVVPGGEAEAMQGLAQTPGFAALKAVRDRRVAFVPAGWLQATSHELASAALRIAEILDEWGRP
jgi:ABC-type Fe3+-hydroxamate transport system substrate-binding protein